MKNQLITVIAALGVSLALAGPTLAQAPPKAPPRVIELEAMVIEGRVAKPQVFYVLGRSRISYEGIRLERSFVERILESARTNPF